MISPEPIFRIHCEVANILDLGAAPFGHRRVVNLLGGTVTGQKLNGRIVPGGADWQVVARDGALDIHARYTIESDAGALIQVDLEGAPAPRPASFTYWRGLRRAARTSIRPLYAISRTVMRFETGHPSADWLNRIIALAKGAREKNAVKLDVYEVL